MGSVTRLGSPVGIAMMVAGMVLFGYVAAQDLLHMSEPRRVLRPVVLGPAAVLLLVAGAFLAGD